jgi:hypothetical protein
MTTDQLRKALLELNGERDAFFAFSHMPDHYAHLHVHSAMLIPDEPDHLIKVTDGKKRVHHRGRTSRLGANRPQTRELRNITGDMETRSSEPGDARERILRGVRNSPTPSRSRSAPPAASSSLRSPSALPPSPRTASPSPRNRARGPLREHRRPDGQGSRQQGSKDAGDGTTTATIYAEAIYSEGLKNITAGANPTW